MKSTIIKERAELSAFDSGQKEQFQYWWNAPRPAIEYPPELLYSAKEKRQQFIERLLAAQQLISHLPKFIKIIINKRLDDIEKKDGLKAANSHLINNVARRTIPRVKSVNDNYRIDKTFPLVAKELQNQFNRLPDLNKDERSRLAFDISLFINSELIQISDLNQDKTPTKQALANYSHIANITRYFKQEPPKLAAFHKDDLLPEDAIAALMRMIDIKWWERRLKRYAEQWREHLFIAMGSVSKKASAYCSFMTKQEWKEQRRRNRQYLEFMELEDEEGNRIPLIDKFEGSNANPEIRRCEMMTRIRGFENISLELGYKADFYTLTAPSKYHANTHAGYKNHKWQGYNPAQTQRYLCGVWAKVRAALARAELPIFGIRVAEPHHDATPHWHMLIFMQPEHVDRVRKIITRYATKEDAHELASMKAFNARFDIEEIDPKKGSATGYVSKYISKNIDGFALDGETCDETGEPLKDTAAAAMAWASRWRIRQFQFIGGAPVSVYRELRRMADSETAHALDLDFAKVHDAADRGNFGEYVKAQGGPFVRRADLVVKMEYVIEEKPNDYGEEIKRVYGVACNYVLGSPIKTRLKKWRIVRPLTLERARATEKAAFAASRSSVNNCTGRSRRKVNPYFADNEKWEAECRRIDELERQRRQKWLNERPERQRLIKVGKEMGLNIGEIEANALVAGGSLNIDDQCYSLVNGEISDRLGKVTNFKKDNFL